MVPKRHTKVTNLPQTIERHGAFPIGMTSIHSAVPTVEDASTWIYVHCLPRYRIVFVATPILPNATICMTFHGNPSRLVCGAIPKPDFPAFPLSFGYICLYFFEVRRGASLFLRDYWSKGNIGLTPRAPGTERLLCVSGFASEQPSHFGGNPRRSSERTSGFRDFTVETYQTVKFVSLSLSRYVYGMLRTITSSSSFSSPHFYRLFFCGYKSPFCLSSSVHPPRGVNVPRQPQLPHHPLNPFLLASPSLWHSLLARERPCPPH